jgi:outer membrane receptor protein involved in Fe transport
MKSMLLRLVSLPARMVVIFIAAGTSGIAAGQTAQADAATQNVGEGQAAQALQYPASFFERYQPNTALEMILQVPGFQLDDGDGDRGFASSAGNLLINDRRPSAKQDAPSEILARIPASQVERIEILRGQVRNVDLQGQSVVANVILLEVDKVAVRWRGSHRHNFDFGGTTEAAISMVNRWGDIDFSSGVDLRDFNRGDYTSQSILDGSGDLTEVRFDVGNVEGFRSRANLNAAKQFGETSVRLNTKIGSEKRDGSRVSDRTPSGAGDLPTEEQFPESYDGKDIELGIDFERPLRSGLLGKAILLYSDKDENAVAAQISLDSLGAEVRERISDTDTETSETIARIEFVWSGYADHTVQINMEGALNSLQNSLLLTEDLGAGPVIIEVPGANSRVEETRWDMLLKDTWTRGLYQFEFGLGGEISTIEQSGDAIQKRDFSFLKPQFAVIYAPNQGKQTRIGLRRDVSQLDFRDFVSSTIFEDDNLAFGNPNLSPESTWKLEVGYQRRFGKDGVLNLLAFHDWVDDVEDLLPLAPIIDPSAEAPGNIGDGRRWGVELESTLPLEWIGLKGAKLDINARWQDSTVVDPVNGDDRVFTSRRRVGRLFPLAYRVENQYAFSIDFRQDFEELDVAWGWDVRARGERPIFRVDELDIGDEGTEFNMFVETTRWLGLKVRFVAEDILDAAETRDRTIYEGLRNLSPVDSQELRSRVRGVRVALTVSGSF